MSKYISKQKYSFDFHGEDFILPVGGDGTEVPADVEGHFLFKLALKTGGIIKLADEAKPEKKAEASKAPEKKAGN